MAHKGTKHMNLKNTHVSRFVTMLAMSLLVYSGGTLASDAKTISCKTQVLWPVLNIDKSSIPYKLEVAGFHAEATGYAAAAWVGLSGVAKIMERVLWRKNQKTLGNLLVPISEARINPLSVHVVRALNLTSIPENLVSEQPKMSAVHDCIVELVKEHNATIEKHSGRIDNSKARMNKTLKAAVRNRRLAFLGRCTPYAAAVGVYYIIASRDIPTVATSEDNQR